MGAVKHDVFISYRRENGAAEARLVRGALIERGLKVFLDVVDLKHGHFDAALLGRIAESAVFVIILSPHSLDKCSEAHDWVRQEIVQALQTGRTIIPVMLPGFEFPGELPPEIQDLPRHQGVQYSHELFDATIDRLLDGIGGSAEGALKPKLAYYGFVQPFWNKLGAKGVLPIALLLALPIGAYSLFAHAVNYSVPRLIGDLGVEFEADDWTVHPFGLSAVARNVRLRPPHEATAVFRADEMEFAGTLGTVLGAVGRDVLSLATLGWQDFGQPFNEVRITHGELNLDLSLNGRLNWMDYWEAVSEKRKAQLAKGLAGLDGVVLEGFKITYVEHVPGHSGGGVIQSAQATINVDDVRGSIADLAVASAGERPARFKFTGRSADGVIGVSGRAAVAGSERSGNRSTSQPSEPSERADFAHFETKTQILLENIGAGAFAKMVPDATGIVATEGSLRGTIDLDMADDHYHCTSNLEMSNVRFAPNPRVILVKAEFDRVQRDLATWRPSGKFEACKPFDRQSDRAGREPSHAKAPALLAAFNAQATADAPLSVRAVAARDQQSLQGVTANTALNEVMSKLAAQAGRHVANVLGQQAGALVEQTLGQSGATDGQSRLGGPTAARDARQSHDDNQLTKGVKSLGHGLKKVFGRRKKNEPGR